MIDTKKAESSLLGIPTVCDYPDIFPEEFLGFPPHREIEFAIDVVQGATSASITPYRMAPLELKELKLRLQELLEKGLFVQVYHHGERQCSLLRRKMVHFDCVWIIGN